MWQIRESASWDLRHKCIVLCVCLSLVALRPNAGHGLLILEVSRSHTQRRIAIDRMSLDE